MSILRRLRPTPAMVVACVALTFALTGTGVAAYQQLVPRNSVASAQIRNNTVLSADLRNGTIARADLASSTVRALRGLTGPAGAAGPAGPAGPAGATGPAGPAGSGKAYAYVLASGDVDEARQRGVADAAVSKPAAGVYCIDIDGGALNAMVTPDIRFGAGIASVGVLLSTCPAGKEVEVHTYTSAGVATDMAFFLLVN